MTSLQDHFSSADSADYLAGIGLSNATIKFKASNPRQFTIKASTGKSDQHEWAHVGGESGSVSSKHLVKNFEQYFQDASSPGSDDSDSAASSRDASEHSVIASLPSGLGNGSFLFESNAIKHKKGGLVWKGTMLDHDYVLNHHQALASAFGESTIHNHLRFDPTHHIIESAPAAASRSRLGRKIPLDDVAVIENGRGALGFGWHSFTHALGSATHAVSHAVTHAASSVAHAGQSVGNAVAHAATSSASAVKNGVSQAVKATDSHVVAPVVHAANVVANAVAGEQSNSFSATFPGVNIYDNMGIFTAGLSVSPRVDGELIFHHGYVGAVDPGTIDLSLEASLPISGSASVDFTQADSLVEKFMGGSVSTTAPIIGEATIQGSVGASLEIDFDLAEGGPVLSASISVAPGASLTLNSSGASFSNTSPHPTVTTVHEGTFDPKKWTYTDNSRATFKLSPSLELIAGPMVPSTVPYVGGKKLATVNTTLSSDVVTTLDFSEPSELDVQVSAGIDGNFTFFDKTIKPDFVNANLFGPIASTVSLTHNPIIDGINDGINAIIDVENSV